MDQRKVNFATRLLNSDVGLRHLERVSSDDPQTYVGIVLEINKLFGGSCIITYFEETGVVLGFKRDKKQMQNLFSQGVSWWIHFEPGYHHFTLVSKVLVRSCLAKSIFASDDSEKAITCPKPAALILFS